MGAVFGARSAICSPGGCSLAGLGYQRALLLEQHLAHPRGCPRQLLYVRETVGTFHALFLIDSEAFAQLARQVPLQIYFTERSESF